MAVFGDRKQKIMEHISRSTGDFIKPLPQNSEDRKRRIMEHIRLTKG